MLWLIDARTTYVKRTKNKFVSILLVYFNCIYHVTFLIHFEIKIAIVFNYWIILAKQFMFIVICISKGTISAQFNFNVNKMFIGKTNTEGSLLTSGIAYGPIFTLHRNNNRSYPLPFVTVSVFIAHSFHSLHNTFIFPVWRTHYKDSKIRLYSFRHIRIQ